MTYNLHKYIVLHCTCRLDLRISSSVRSCPDSLRIRKHLADRTGFQGQIIEGAKVCYPCYKSHICILRDDDTESTDDDLLGIIASLKMSLGSVSDIQSRAMTDTCIYVANTILKHEALLYLQSTSISPLQSKSICLQLTNSGRKIRSQHNGFSATL